MCLLLLIFVINILQEVHPSLPYKNLHKIFYTTEKTLKKCFDPLFSTDPKKFGLGLTIVKGIVETHNGYIEIKSKKDSGTTVNIYFPSVT